MSAQQELQFFGPDLEPHDVVRLGKQLLLVKGIVTDGRWRTLRRIAELSGAPEASVSARLRDLRRYGYEVSRRRVAPMSGAYEYRVTKVQQ